MLHAEETVQRFLKRFISLTLPTIFLCFVFGELFFRSVIPAAKQPWGYYDPIDQIPRFELDQGTGLYTIGKFAEQRGQWRINNAGWNSDIDYVAPDRRTKPLIAIIGDSYIEALQVDVKDSIVSVLRRKVQDQYDVYGFGQSGGPLSQYLQMSRYVTKRFNPAVLVINVVHNDFDESLLSVHNVPYFLEIDISDSEPKESTLPSVAITAKRTTKLVFRSSIFRYLWHNLKYGELWTESWLRQNGERGITVKEKKGSLHQKSEIYQAADYIVKKMKEETAGKELIFMVDAPRKDIYRGTLQNSDVLWMNQLLENLSRRYHARFVDLTRPFNEKFKRDRVKFNSTYDYHWNEEGHKYAAEVLYRNLVKFGIVKAGR